MARVSPSPALTGRAWCCGAIVLLLSAPLPAPAAPAADRPSSPGVTSEAPQSSRRVPGPVVVPDAGFGFADGMSILSLTPRALERQLTAVERTGATWLRVPVNWSQIEQRRGRFQWTVLDRIVRKARRHDLSILANISQAPRWARALLSEPSAPPQDPSTYARFSAAVAKRYRGKITHWEIWNEPNLNGSFGGIRTHGNAPELYSRLLKPAYRAIHRVQRRPVVVAGALAAGTDSSSSYSMSAFVRRMYDAGARGSFDALALHPYIGSGTDATRRRVYADVQRVRRLMVEHHNKQLAIWWTELGHSTWAGGVSPQAQRRLILEQLEAAAGRAYVGPAFVYAIRDNGASTAEVGANFGSLLSHDFEPKPLYRTLRRSHRSRSE